MSWGRCYSCFPMPLLIRNFHFDLVNGVRYTPRALPSEPDCSCGRIFQLRKLQPSSRQLLGQSKGDREVRQAVPDAELGARSKFSCSSPSSALGCDDYRNAMWRPDPASSATSPSISPAETGASFRWLNHHSVSRG